MPKYTLLSRAIKTSLMTCVIGTVSVGSVSAQEQAAADENYEKIVITGARGAPRSLSDSPVPVDVLSEDDILSAPFSDTNDILKTLIPSYTLERQPISDGASFIRPASLRGLPTDKTLVLINSKRRHRSALVEIGGSGTQGPDIATIPSAALKGAEVLRDGAAAQYGSDAIAGVINFVLKDNDEGGSLSVNVGQYYEGDGEQVNISGNIGFNLNDKGFVSVSGEITDTNSTSRSRQYCTNSFCLNEDDPRSADNPFLNDPTFVAGLADANLGGEDVVQPWGQPNYSATKLFINSGYEISDTMKFYAFGNYVESEGDGSFFYRFPGNGTIEDVRQEDGSIYSPLEQFAGGFTPRFFGDITDISLLAGLEGEFSNEMTYDFSARFGSNEIEYTIRNTINPSLGADSPTEFRPGDLINEELQFSADFTKHVDMGLFSDVLFAFGATYMEETYEIVQGNAESFEVGDFSSADPFGFCNDDGTATANGLGVIADGSTLDCADENDPVFQAVGVGSNGFPGFSPEFSDIFERDMYGVYIDASTDLSDELFVQVAARYEDYSDFGDELVGKFAFRYVLTDDINLRGSFGTGFRAPTPGQQATTNVSTRVIDGVPIATGLFPALSAVGQALGAEELAPETSINYSLGLTAGFDELNITLDFYRIELEDRFSAVSTLDVSSNPNSGVDFERFQALEAAGVDGAESIGGVNFFQNAFDSITEGMDLIATYTLPNTVFTASINYNSTEFDSDPAEFLDGEDQFDFLNGTPEWRGVVSAKHNFDRLSVLVRANIFGSYENAIDNAATVTQDFDSVVFFDLEANYQISDSLNFALGARNLFDEFPDKDGVIDSDGNFRSDGGGTGNIYWTGDSVDWQGGYYYARFTYSF